MKTTYQKVNWVFNVVIFGIVTLIYSLQRTNKGTIKYTPARAYTYYIERQKSGVPNPERWKNGKFIENQNPVMQEIRGENNKVEWNDAADIPSFKLFLLAEMSCVNNPFVKYRTAQQFNESAIRAKVYNEILESHGESPRCNCIQDKIEHIMSPTKDGTADEEYGDMVLKLKTETNSWAEVYKELIPKVHNQCKKFAVSLRYKISETKMDCLIGVITWWCFSVAVLSMSLMQTMKIKRKKSHWIEFIAIVLLLCVLTLGCYLSSQAYQETKSGWIWIFITFSVLLLSSNALLWTKIDQEKENENENENEKWEETNYTLTIPFLFTYALLASSNLSFIFTGEKEIIELNNMFWITLLILPLIVIMTYMDINDNDKNKENTYDKSKNILYFTRKWLWSLGLLLSIIITTTVCQKYNETIATPNRIMQLNTLLIASGILFFFPDLQWRKSNIFAVFVVMEQIARFVTAFLIIVLLMIDT